MNLDRPVAPDPYDSLPAVPSFVLESEDLVPGEPMPSEYTQPHGNTSPHLSWRDFPPETQSFVVSCFDPDAPTPSGYWHWTIVDLDSTVTFLERGQGESDLFLPGAASHVRTDGGLFGWEGANPPEGDRPHRYIFAVHALDVDSLGLDPDETSPAAVAFNALFHTIARATLEVTYQQ
ncbi:YbhB/YbcL family Raf kinase inhibitor-like protein [Flaviflexus salsibiostraticola]|uniref:YbhB/YbcL family Raf kinase inhibitor-like protein n=1 Tax=Flaviflexus salsibiostraticola TaxID=1282737 RepID=A0A3Q8WTV3_9ACTO|nr:YbhB/YbcL family Raf kinase inhibitor-like protein [Flaviflexus salsibiostraticola]AZN29127.1 YbhB/YbcL family Raf kinase inhibitor-like protein [Flaviflexus salsibiostraticola]